MQMLDRWEEALKDTPWKVSEYRYENIAQMTVSHVLGDRDPQVVVGMGRRVLEVAFMVGGEHREIPRQLHGLYRDDDGNIAQLTEHEMHFDMFESCTTIRLKYEIYTE